MYSLRINPCSLKQAKMGAQQWRTAQESLLNLEKNNVAAVDSIVRYVLSRNIIKVSQSWWFMCFLFFIFGSFTRGGMEANQNIHAQFSSAVSTALQDADVANSSLLTSIDCQYLDSLVVRFQLTMDLIYIAPLTKLIEYLQIHCNLTKTHVQISIPWLFLVVVIWENWRVVTTTRL